MQIYGYLVHLIEIHTNMILHSQQEEHAGRMEEHAGRMEEQGGRRRNVEEGGGARSKEEEQGGRMEDHAGTRRNKGECGGRRRNVEEGCRTNIVLASANSSS